MTKAAMRIIPRAMTMRIPRNTPMAIFRRLVVQQP